MDTVTELPRLHRLSDFLTDEPDRDYTPVLLAYENKAGTWSAWCSYCRQWHVHGAVEGHRTAPCPDGTGYARPVPEHLKHNRTNAYILVFAGKLTAAVRKLKRPEWSEILRREPRLAQVLADAQAVRDEGGSYFCANKVWYGWGQDDHGLKGRVSSLVGWNVDDPFLRHSLVYDVAYQTCYNPLPACRNCMCM